MVDLGEVEKEVMKRIEEGLTPEQLPTVIKRCPKCKRATLQFDPTLNRLFCTHCDFSMNLRT
jgi:hypothetical protein